MKPIAILLCAAFAFTAVSASAFDDQRTGITLGTNAGAGRITGSDHATASGKNEIGFYPTLSLGVGFSSQTNVSLEIAPLIYSTDRNSTYVLTTTLSGKWFVNPSQTSPHIGGLIGLSFDGSRGYDGTPPIVGYIGGVSVGYLFDHVDAEVRVATGRRFLEPETLTILSLSVGYLFF